MKKKFKKSIKKQVKAVRWLLPGWVAYQYYQVHKLKGFSPKKSLLYGAQAEALRLATTASLPIPGTYELTTAGLANLKKKIENDEVKKLSLKEFKEIDAIKKLRVDKEELMKDFKKKN